MCALLRHPTRQDTFSSLRAERLPGHRPCHRQLSCAALLCRLEESGALGASMRLTVIDAVLSAGGRSELPPWLVQPFKVLHGLVGVALSVVARLCWAGVWECGSGPGSM